MSVLPTVVLPIVPPTATFAESGDFIYETITESLELPREDFEMVLESLVTVGYIERIVDSSDDSCRYKAGIALNQSVVAALADPVKRAILRQLLDNPKSLFILFNTQKGKSRLAAQQIGGWQSLTDRKMVAIVVVANDTTLSDQTLESYLGSIGRRGTGKASAERGVFLLSSTAASKATELQIVDYINAYRGAPVGDIDYPMPLILALKNNAQVAKVLKILERVRSNHVAPSRLDLFYSVIFDEADVTYPALRARFAPYLLEDDKALHELVFVTATGNPLLDDNEFPECENARLVKSDIDEEDRPYYCAYHTLDSAVHKLVLCPPKQSNNQIAMAMLHSNDVYFKNALTLPTGEVYQRKIIVNGNTKGVDMREFAGEAVAIGYHAMVFNQSGLTIYREGESPLTLKTKGLRFNELLFYVYKRFGLHTKPLMIMGRRKVDRGLGFHYAPRRAALGPRTFDFGGHGHIETDGKEGLIWTDMFLGRIEDKNTAVQKAGRLAGIVAHCPQFPGALTWWVEEWTGKEIARHNKIVDGANALSGSHTAGEAKKAAAVSHPAPVAVNPYTCSESFATNTAANAWAAIHINWTHEDLATKPKKPLVKPGNVTPCDPTGGTAKTHLSARGPGGARVREPIVSREDLLRSHDLSRWGEGARCVPVLAPAGLQWVIAYKRVWEKTVPAAVGGAGVGPTAI